MKCTTLAVACAAGVTGWVQATSMTITLTGQSMIRSDIRATAPEQVPEIQGLLKGDVVFTNLEAAVAESGETVHEGRGFLTPPEALDALKALGFNLLAFANNHAFDLGVTGIQNTIREAGNRQIAHAGTGNNATEAAAPTYLHTPKGTLALIASASGLIVPGGKATPNHPGVNATYAGRVIETEVQRSSGNLIATPLDWKSAWYQYVQICDSELDHVSPLVNTIIKLAAPSFAPTKLDPILRNHFRSTPTIPNCLGRTNCHAAFE